jgi:hypothetical protein
MAILHMPERVVAVTKLPQREISGRGCFAIATTRSGRFFPLIEHFHCLSVTYILHGFLRQPSGWSINTPQFTEGYKMSWHRGF